jgi:lipoprotein-anchoring transpeptidase ErfK/SrfK
MRRLGIRVAVVAVTCAVLVGAPASAWGAYDGGDVCVATGRIAGADRFETAAALALAAFPGWDGVRAVVIASGEDAALSDALAASTLTSVLDAPLVLVRRDGVPAPAVLALRAIASRVGTVPVVVVGGPGSISDACLARVAAELGGSVETTRVFGSDRYGTAAAVASVVASATSDGGRRVLIANGEPSRGLVDALAAANAGAALRAPVLYVARNSVPAATAARLAALDPSEVILLGGPGVVSDEVAQAVGATERWWGADRYGTAAAAATAVWKLGGARTGSAIIARTVADAVASAQLGARGGGPLLLVSATGVPEQTARCISASDPPVTTVTIVGGTSAVPQAVAGELQGAPHAPAITTPKSGSLVAKKANVSVRTGVNTARVRLYRGATLIAEKAAAPFSTVVVDAVAMPSDGEALRAVAVSQRGTTTQSAARYRRLAYPAATSIVIDKSDFRLYWVKGDVLVKSYPVAIGRPGMETPVAMWKVGAKYYTDPASVYGPRKMRLFRRVGSGDSVRYVYTAYGIHGTNQPWVIGTKASHGCIRMYNKDVLELFPQVPLGTLVQTRE